jgi:hypothetical protein
MKRFLLPIFAAVALSWLPKGSSQSHNSEVPPQQIAQVSPGVLPISPWQCPLSHVIKGNFTTYNGERCIYHVPSGAFYDKTKPERCYVTHQDAVADGCRQSKR